MFQDEIEIMAKDARASTSRIKDYVNRAVDAAALHEKHLGRFLPLRIKQANKLNQIDFHLQTNRNYIENCVAFYFAQLFDFKKDHNQDADSRVETPQCAGLWFRSITQCPPFFSSDKPIDKLTESEFDFILDTLVNYAFYFSRKITCSHGKIKNNSEQVVSLFNRTNSLASFLKNHLDSIELTGLVGMFETMFCLCCK
ncbi:MAG: hypothetical protein LBU64_07665 [Planctomycetota bacterium]|jgi:hypothetical protein|nr:hypothetical protein [Planctomycetota bacterium]